jgi:hypothetical protein
MTEIFVVKSSELEGSGCFAIEDIKKGAVICTFNGEKISFQELKKRYDEGKEKICNPLQIGEKEYLVEKLPSFYEYMGYMYYCGGTIAGPFFEYKDYTNFINRTNHY